MVDYDFDIEFALILVLAVIACAGSTLFRQAVMATMTPSTNPPSPTRAADTLDSWPCRGPVSFSPR